MKEFTNEDYVKMKENGYNIFRDKIHEKRVG